LSKKSKQKVGDNYVAKRRLPYPLTVLKRHISKKRAVVTPNRKYRRNNAIFVLKGIFYPQLAVA